jgi:hypothetical protein
MTADGTTLLVLANRRLDARTFAACVHVGLILGGAVLLGQAVAR